VRRGDHGNGGLLGQAADAERDDHRDWHSGNSNRHHHDRRYVAEQLTTAPKHFCDPQSRSRA
jgi:hypothetical protein